MGTFTRGVYACLLASLSGCLSLNDRKYEELVQDYDGDGELAERFGGRDCRDGDPGVVICDKDSDGFNGPEADGPDCDDRNALIHPTAEEKCNGVDDDCDGLVDDNDLMEDQLKIVFYADGDEDGFGTDAILWLGCDPEEGFVRVAGDCDDTREDVRPTAPELCDSVDHNCDGDPLLDATNPMPWFFDEDGDGFGDAQTPASCEPPEGAVAEPGDCDDADENTFPGAPEICYDGVDQGCDGGDDFDCDGDGEASLAEGQGPDCDDSEPTVNTAATEICDGLDNDCDANTDDADASLDLTTTEAWFPDLDEDGYGDSSANAKMLCAGPALHVMDATDCNDEDDNTHPTANEFCDAEDRDCDGDATDGAVDQITYYADNDGDTFGFIGSPVPACAKPPGAVRSAEDCDDLDENVFPGAEEICYDGIRQDCTDGLLYDCDGDGVESADFGGGDCDDGDATIVPGALEACDGIDNDCDGLVDDVDPDVDLSTATTWYPDLDGDGVGVTADGVSSCGAPPNHVLLEGDCDDDDEAVYPGADEICDGVDNDCDGDTDTGNVVGAPTFFADVDRDGFGNATVFANDSCEQPPTGFWATNGDDCDDAFDVAFPGGIEVCDGLDNDCDGQTDINAENSSTFYRDGDGDGFGAPTIPIQACAIGDGIVTDNTDCNDADALVNPGATEICYDSIRQDCSTADINDCDSDGFVSDMFGGTDCEDEEPLVNPDGVEECDGLDNDCDGLLDDADPDVDLGSSTDWYPDGDGDGYGLESGAQSACSQPAGHVLQAGDCDDTDAAASPDADETCDGVDNNCDGLTDVGTITDPPTFYADNDSDSFGNPNNSSTGACFPPVGNWVLDNTDCKDADSDVYPTAPEVCDGKDNNCDSEIDDNDPDDVTGQNTWYRDQDADGYATTSSIDSCNQPSGYINDAAPRTDCNDADPTVNPGAAEVCNSGKDDDCDGDADTNDPDVVDTVNWYRDADDDGYGVITDEVVQCVQPVGYVGNSTDCNDNNRDQHPGAQEVCDNGIDNNCNGFVDDNDPTNEGIIVWYEDSDGDGFGDSSSTLGQCAQPAGYEAEDGDCDDTNPTINPDAQELCAAPDEDCDGLFGDQDPSVEASAFWVPDADGDGQGNDSVVPFRACEQPANTVAALQAVDCDDSDPNIFLGAPETYYDGIDSDCNGGDDFDQDGDGQASLAEGAGPDCNDFDSTVRVGAEDLFYDGVDANCDGSDDFDQDGDGFGAILPLNPGGDDCNDLDDEVHPGAVDVWYDGKDTDCSGNDDFDQDGDGQASRLYPGHPQSANAGLDCHDLDANVFSRGTLNVPSAAFPTIPDAVDGGCDGDVIVVAAGTHPEPVVFAGKSMTLRGAGEGTTLITGTTSAAMVTVVDGTDPVFPAQQPQIDASVLIEDLTVGSGFGAVSAGGVVVRADQTVDLVRVTVQDNVSAANGAGAHVADGGMLIVDDSTFASNQAAADGGAIYVADGGALVVMNSTFSGNIATRGGALAGLPYSIDLIDTVFENQEADEHTVMLLEDLGTDTTFTGVRVVQSLLANNSTSPGVSVYTGIQSLMIGDSDLLGAGASSYFEGTTSLTNCTVGGTVNPAVEARGLFDMDHCAVLSNRPEGVIMRDAIGEFSNTVFLDSHDQPGLLATYPEPAPGTFLYTQPEDTFITLDSALSIQPTMTTSATEDYDDDGEFVGIGFSTVVEGCNPSTAVDLCWMERISNSNPYEFMTYHPKLHPSRWDLHLRTTSDLVGAGRSSGGAGVDIGRFGGAEGVDPSYYSSTDGDLMFDGWELEHGLNPLINDAGMDLDGDGLNNLTEFNSGSLPDEADTDDDGCNDSSDPSPLIPFNGLLGGC